MRRKITAIASAATLAASGLLLATAGSAHADIGTIHVVQFDGGTDSTQNYTVANLFAPLDIKDTVTSHAKTAVITNNTNETIRCVDNATVSIPPGATGTLNITGDKFFDIDVPAGL